MPDIIHHCAIRVNKSNTQISQIHVPGFQELPKNGNPKVYDGVWKVKYPVAGGPSPGEFPGPAVDFVDVALEPGKEATPGPIFLGNNFDVPEVGKPIREI